MSAACVQDSPVEHLGLRDELLVVLPADDHELVADDRRRRRGPGMLEGRKLFPLAVAERENLVRRLRDGVGGAPDDHHLTAVCRRRRVMQRDRQRRLRLPRPGRGS